MIVAYEDIAIEVAQEVAPETEFNDEPLRTLVADEIERILHTLDKEGVSTGNAPGV
jgi:hypothetical protein